VPPTDRGDDVQQAEKPRDREALGKAAQVPGVLVTNGQEETNDAQIQEGGMEREPVMAESRAERARRQRGPVRWVRLWRRCNASS
jgi:hypothetical protein